MHHTRLTLPGEELIHGRHVVELDVAHALDERQQAQHPGTNLLRPAGITMNLSVSVSRGWGSSVRRRSDGIRERTQRLIASQVI
jgi:hypothetical protein